MGIIITTKPSRDKTKIWYYIEWGKQRGQRLSTAIFTFNKPKDRIEKNHNKEAKFILESKRSQMVLDQQAINSGYLPQHKIKGNFLEYYEAYIKKNKLKGNRHLKNSLSAFKKFLGKEYLSPIDISEDLCKQFRDFLLNKYNGETPSGYFMRFKRVLKSASKEGYFRHSPAEDLPAKVGMNKKIKEILNAEEYNKLMKTPCLNYEVKKAFVFSLYTGMRWTDIKPLLWVNIKADSFEIIQKKTSRSLEAPLHDLAKTILGERKNGLVFKLPTQDGANKILKKWCVEAKLDKHITWHCARHSFSVLLQQNGVDIATVAGMLGHTTTKYVHQTYKRYSKSQALEAIQKLPT